MPLRVVAMLGARSEHERNPCGLGLVFRQSAKRGNIERAAAYRRHIALARPARLILPAHVGRMMCNRIFGLHVGLQSGIFAGAILVAVGVTPVHAQSGDPISPPANTVGPAGSTPSPDHVRKPTEPPPFDPNRPAARAARVKAPPPAAPAPGSDAAQPKAPTRSVPSAAPRTAESTPHATSPRPATPTTPSAGAAQPRRPATAVDPWAEPATTPAPVSHPTARQRSIDPSAEPAMAPASMSQSTTRRAEPAKVIGIDSLGRSSEDLSPEPSPAARRRRGAGPGAEAAPAETTGEALPR
jgi:hypothetical protein